MNSFHTWTKRIITWIIISSIIFSELLGSGPSHKQAVDKLPADSSYFFSTNYAVALAKVLFTQQILSSEDILAYWREFKVTIKIQS